MDPLLIDVPETLETERWLLRRPRPGDGAALNAAISMRIELMFHIRERAAGDDGPLLGAISLSRMNWDIPRFEIGYWRRSGHGQRGVMTEAVIGLSGMAFDALNAERVEIRMDDKNVRSWGVAERAGFMLDGVLRREARSVTGELRDTRVYSRVRGDLLNFASGVERTATR